LGWKHVEKEKIVVLKVCATRLGQGIKEQVDKWKSKGGDKEKQRTRESVQEGRGIYTS
jgi:hypothetical protein